MENLLTNSTERKCQIIRVDENAGIVKGVQSSLRKTKAVGAQLAFTEGGCSLNFRGETVGKRDLYRGPFKTKHEEGGGGRENLHVL